MNDNRLKIMRKAKRKTQAEIAELIGITQNAYSYWENGKVKIDAESLRKLADYYNVSLDFISGRKYKLTHPVSNWPEDMKSDYYKAKDFEKSYLEYLWGKPVFMDDYSAEIVENQKSPQKRSVKIPVLGNVAAGIPMEAITDVEDWEEIPEEWQGEYVALKIHGDSMLPRMLDGDVVIVKIQQTIENGETAIVLVNGGDATCKRIQKTPDGISLISINPAYTPIFYSNEQIEQLPVRIFGKVVELRGKF